MKNQGHEIAVISFVTIKPLHDEIPQTVYDFFHTHAKFLTGTVSGDDELRSFY